MKSRLRPSRSASHPVMGRLIALATRNEVSTHVISSTPGGQAAAHVVERHVRDRDVEHHQERGLIMVVMATIARSNRGLIAAR